MWPIGNMVWSIGDIVDVDDQIDWIAHAGFRGVSFHACAGQMPYWQGVDPAAADARRRAQLRRRLEAFDLCEIHAPFAVVLTSGNIAATVDKLTPILELGRDVGADVVTVHAEYPPPATDCAAAWPEALKPLDAQAAACGLVIGLEVLDGFDPIQNWPLANIGVTLDVGHLCAAGGQAPPRFGTIGNAVHRIGGKLVHLHVHDHNGTADHIEIGTGRIDFGGLLKALKETRYTGGMCLEMNPARVTPEGIIRSREYLERRARALGLD